MEQKENLCDEVETASEFTYLADRVSTGGGCEAAVTARTRCGWLRLRECGELLYGRYPIKLKGAANKSYVRPVALYGSEAWCLKESEMGTLQSTERSMLRCGVQLKDRRISTDMMLMLGLKETIYQFAMANNIHSRGHVWRREDGNILRMTLDFEVEGQRKKGRPKRMWKMQVEEESMTVGIRRKDALCRTKWSVGVNKIAVRLR